MLRSGATGCLAARRSLSEYAIPTWLTAPQAGLTAPVDVTPASYSVAFLLTSVVAKVAMMILRFHQPWE